MDGSGFTLTSVEAGVRFDITGTGKTLLISWTAANSTNAWLALDRNGNRVIDSGVEISGNNTPQPNPATGVSKNGFLALAMFDKSENEVIMKSLLMQRPLSTTSFFCGTILIMMVSAKAVS